MNKNYILIGIVIVIFLMIISLISTYNSIVRLDEEVNAAWAQVDVQLKRRADLIPNIVETVKGYANFEKETLTSVIEARAKALGAKTIDEKIDANNQFGQAISRLLVLVENYPDLKANENFKALITELEGTENRISVERKRYNDIVATYNKKIRQFPIVFFARMFGFTPKKYFEITEEEKQVPKVKF
ncbi:MAG: LemA family protein [Spirochaetes bacterium]|nr:LemA family protein [Spirochaetota bacterium]